MADVQAIPSCGVGGVGEVTVTYIGTATPANGFIVQLLLGGVVSHEASVPSGSFNHLFTPVANGTYSAKVLSADDQSEIGSADGIVVDCTPPDPGPGPEPEPEPEIPGTATPPAAKYMAVGGTLSNPIEYTFAFQVNDAAGDPKTGHYVVVNIYKGDEVIPSATARARIKNGSAKVDVSRYVQSMLSITPPTVADTIQADTGALVRYHIGFVEVWGTVVMDEVMVGDKYAVNAALQSQVNDFAAHVIDQPIL